MMPPPPMMAALVPANPARGAPPPVTPGIFPSAPALARGAPMTPAFVPRIVPPATPAFVPGIVPGTPNYVSGGQGTPRPRVRDPIDSPTPQGLFPSRHPSPVARQAAQAAGPSAVSEFGSAQSQAGDDDTLSVLDILMGFQPGRQLRL